MVPKLAAKGTSFKGAAAYYLHDKGATTSDRVAWTATLNLATENPEVAWRVMAATAMQQDKLKALAGVRNTGRKSSDVVLAYSLAWHPDEKTGLSRDDMLEAAKASIDALGANDRQILIVCHDDEPHPHVHVIVNRVSPADGRMLSSSNEKLNLSKWAQAYEQGRGKIFCEERVANNEARNVLKEFTRATKDKSRHVYEAEQKARNIQKERPDLVKKVREGQRVKDAALSQKGRDMHNRHREQWAELKSEHQNRKKKIEAVTIEAINRTRHNIRERDREKWREIFKRHYANERSFEGRERRIGGKLQNAISAIMTMGTVRGEESGKGFLGTAFNFLTSSESRREALKRHHEGEKKSFVAKQRAEIKSAIAEVRVDRRALLASNLKTYEIDRQDLRLKQSMDRASLQAHWLQRNNERKDDWAKLHASMMLRRQVSTAFAKGGMTKNKTQDRER